MLAIQKYFHRCISGISMDHHWFLFHLPMISQCWYIMLLVFQRFSKLDNGFFSCVKLDKIRLETVIYSSLFRLMKCYLTLSDKPPNETTRRPTMNRTRSFVPFFSSSTNYADFDLLFAPQICHSSVLSWTQL